mgnify:CR=1 FL=1
MQSAELPKIQRVRLDIAYDGTHYMGWQRLGQGRSTIQGTLEAIIGKLLNHEIYLMGSGRTDSGVHARRQVAHFDTTQNLQRYQLVNAINALTPPDIKIKAAYLCPGDFHALAQVKRKIYKYYILNRPVSSAFNYRYTWWIRKPLDIEYLNLLSQILVGRHDFASFRTQGSPVKSTVRQVYSATWKYKRPDLLVFTVCGNGFLKQMIRNIVGTLVDFHLRGKDTDALLQVLKAQDRRQAGPTAPPQGLFLHNVIYPSHLDIKCRKL